MTETFGQRLRRLRKERGLKQWQLQVLAGVGGEMISYHEREHCKTRPYPSSVKKLAQALRVAPTELDPDYNEGEAEDKLFYHKRWKKR